MSTSTPIRSLLAGAAIVVALAGTAQPAAAQTPQTPAPQDTAPQTPTPPREMDLMLVNLPTTMSLRGGQSYFRLTHRFARDLRRGDFGSLVEDLFSLDNGAIIGLEYRIGITNNLHAGVHRSMLSKTIQVFSRFDALRQSDTMPVGVSAIASIEGLNNLEDNHQPSIAAVVSRHAGPLMLYAMPAFVGNTRAADFLTGHDDHDHDLGEGEEADEHSDHEHTVVLGLGTRWRVRPSFYVSGEVAPRLNGHDPGRAMWAFAAEKHTRGHVLALGLTNSFGTTFGQLARGGSDHDIYLGFNITRRF